MSQFSHLPKTKLEVTDYYNYVKVPSLDNLDASRLITSQEEGDKYLKEFESKFGTPDNYEAKSEQYIQLKASWCTSRTAE